ncbi:DUF6402 family protein [Lysobacter auxotrophicus]|uniref:DUF6402 family protein n=1 Tax=Lysobacter auxotrophicus TaxID=2992573 RepID=A0ABM8DHD0_9GAMM|nr:DUF6402 family protein [Lysobacter auxotrophicus]BDU18060.1 DUF6402 family protein [Lysobacter auxotrophicus]
MGLSDFSALNALKPDTLILTSSAKSRTSPVDVTQGKRITIDRLSITQIPHAMRTMGWSTAASLMERWFQNEAWELPGDFKVKTPPISKLHPSMYDGDIVKVAWAQRFPRVAEALRDVHGRRFNIAAIQELCQKLRGVGWDGMRAQALGADRMPAAEIDSICQVNVRPFGALGDTLDEVYGALGYASAKVGLIGNAWFEAESGRRYFHVKRSALYLRDTYDFTGPQFLGIWTKSRVLTKAEQMAVTVGASNTPDVASLDEGAFMQVWNHDFNRYRKSTGRGGDFLVFSDVHWVDEDRVIDITSAWDSIRGDADAHVG